MPTINLPTEAERAAVDVDSFTWSNSEPGALTKPHGALIKLIIDQLESGEGVQVISPARGTGKTPKFIVQNTTNGANLKVVIRDDFSEAKTDDGSGHGNNTTRTPRKFETASKLIAGDVKLTPQPITTKEKEKMKNYKKEKRKIKWLEAIIKARNMDMKIAQLEKDELEQEEYNEKMKDEQIEPNPIKMINPEIISLGENLEEREEGCLSIPGYNAKIKRPSSLKVKYTDENKKDNIIDAEGLLATCIQHEIDHLNGILFIDHLSKLKREIILKKAIKEYSKN